MNLKKSPKIVDDFHCRFFAFCHDTSLHGWRYLIRDQPVVLCFLWFLVILSTSALGIRFVIINTEMYMKSYISTSIETTVAPLSVIYFPSITVCNVNQVEASFLMEHGFHGNLSQTSALFDEYISGKKGGLTEDQKKQLESLISSSWYLKEILAFAPITVLARQTCRNMFLQVSYRGKSMYWRQFDDLTLGPYYYGTDYGACCFFNGEINMKKWPINTTEVQRYHSGVQLGANNGENNGMAILLNAENFNYAYHRASGSGFKIAIQDHRDKPIMGNSAIFVRAGTETLIAVAPTITYTTKNAIEAMTPVERKCYTDSEANLTYFPYTSGYGYSMSNCLFNEAITKIAWDCGCWPNFHNKYDDKLNHVPYCSGEKLLCLQSKLSTSVGNLDQPGNYVGTINVTRPPSVPCLPNCHLQDNPSQLSFFSFPHKSSFVYQRQFCETSSHIFQVNCQSPERKHFLDFHHPKLCEVLAKYKSYFGKDASCDTWPDDYFEDNSTMDKQNNELVNAVHQYASENLASVKIMIRDPYVTKISRDEAMTFTSYVANTGGLLGLCIGCSFISFMEICYHCIFRLVYNCFKVRSYST